MKKYLPLLIVLTLFSCDPIKKLYVKFGDEKTVLEKKKDTVIRIFFDRQGVIYPDINIPDSKIESKDSRLGYLYKNDKSLFLSACKKHELADTATIDQLQQRLIDQKAKLLNDVNPVSQLVFLIHGFNKHPVKPIGQSAYDEYKVLREKITTLYPAKKIQFVEIYWDGCTWVNGKPSRENTNSFKIWDNAQAASNLVALELRRILYKITRPDNVVITHSLGASIITCALFNVNKFDLNNNPNDFKKKILTLYADSINYKTPLAKFRIGMLAPAIPGINSFDEFSERVPKSQTDPGNLSFIVGYNIYDPALIKIIGLPKSFGATSLGCLKTEVDNVENMLNNKTKTVIEDVSFSNRADGSRQNIHALTEYVANGKPMNAFLEILFK